MQSVTRSITFQKAQLPRIAVDLENVAANLAEAQRFSTNDLQALDGQLHVVDALIGQALDHDEDCSDLEDDAINMTKQVFDQITSIRDDYSAKLEQSAATMHADGYDPAHLIGLDGDAQPTIEEHDTAAVGTYDAGQRTKDQALVDTPGPMTPDKPKPPNACATTPSPTTPTPTQQHDTWQANASTTTTCPNSSAHYPPTTSSAAQPRTVLGAEWTCRGD